MNQKEEDILLAKACSNGQRSAQHFLYKKYGSVLYAIALRYLGDQEEAKDLLHDGFLKIYSKIHLFNGEGSLEGWMKRLIVNTCISVLRAKKRLRFGEFEDQMALYEPYESHGESIQCTFTKEDVMSCLHNLQEEYRIVFQLFALDEYSHKEIALHLGIQENTSRARYHRAKKQIKQHLQTLRPHEDER